LLDPFTIQDFSDIGSMLVDTKLQTKVDSLENLTIPETFYYDNINSRVYICLLNYDSPYIHNVFLGVVFGYSYNEFVPIDSNQLYEGRLSGTPSVSISRDPMFFGKIQYNSSSAELINGDGEFDTYPDTKDMYGNPCRLKIGFEELPIDDYQTIYTGTIGNTTVSEQAFNVSFTDPRKSLTKDVQYTCSNENAITAIQNILVQNYNVEYTSSFFNTTEWELARASAQAVTINITGDDYEKAIDLIEKICTSTFGYFIIDSVGKYSFQFSNISASASSTIYASDIINYNEISYDPSEVITSTKIGYDYTSVGDSYTYFFSNSTEEGANKEKEIYLRYKVYNQKNVQTYLPTAEEAQALSDKILDYAEYIHGIGSVTVPLKYYTLQLGDIVNIELNREKVTMLGTKKCEIIGITYNLSVPTITIKYRIA
jgi:hypothetical protein